MLQQTDILATAVPGKPRIILSGCSGAIGSALLKLALETIPGEYVCLYHRQRPDPGPGSLPFKAIQCDLTDSSQVDHAIRTLPRHPFTLGIHAAADVSWKKSLDEVAPLNIDGTLNFCRLLKATSDEGRLIYLSSAYTSRDSPEFRNNYERSKALAENRMRSEFSDLPTATFSCSLVVGDSRTGQISRFHGLYPLIRFLATQDAPFLVAEKGCVIDIVPLDWVCSELLGLAKRMLKDPGAEDVQVTSGELCLTAEELIRGIYDRVNHHLANCGWPQRKGLPTFIPKRRWAFLRRSLNTWNVPNLSPKRFSTFQKLIESYGYYTGFDQVLPSKNIHSATPDPREYLPVVVDYWINRNLRCFRQALQTTA